ncbi:MAG TPA: hypothetical protein VE175_00695 [Woeseiaceae bacterium]|nr:hypothetical protein [Woeseiaceae bacterium]
MSAKFAPFHDMQEVGPAALNDQRGRLMPGSAHGRISEESLAIILWDEVKRRGTTPHGAQQGSNPQTTSSVTGSIR